MTKLDAINTILTGIGETSVETIDGANGTYTTEALNTLARVTDEVLLSGWHFNTDKSFPLKADGSSEISLPQDVHRAIFPTGSQYVMRGRKIYDTARNTFSIGHDLAADVVRFLRFEDIPATFQHYITLRAARKFQNNVLGADSIRAAQEIDENEARFVCMKEEQTASRPTLQRGGNGILNGWSVAKTLRR